MSTDNTKTKQSNNITGICVGFEILPQQSSSAEAFMAITAHPTMTSINLRKTKLKKFSMQMYRAEEIYAESTVGESILMERSVALKKYPAEPGRYTIVGHYIHPEMGEQGMTATGHIYGRKGRRNFSIPVDLVILPEGSEPMGFSEYISLQFEELRKKFRIGETGLFYNNKLTIEKLTEQQIWDQLIKKGWAQPRKK